MFVLELPYSSFQLASGKPNCLGGRSLLQRRSRLLWKPFSSREWAPSSWKPGKLHICPSQLSSSMDSGGLLVEQPGSVQRFVLAFNERDLEGMMELLSPDCCYQNLAYLQPQMGKEEVRRMFQTLLDATPPDWRLLIDDSTEPAGTLLPSAHSVAISWHMEARGKTLPLLSGLSFYKINDQGKICYIKEAAEQAVKLPAPITQLLGGVAPFLEALAGPAVTPLSATVPAAPRAGGSKRRLASTADTGRSSSRGAAGSGVAPAQLSAPLSEQQDALGRQVQNRSLTTEAASTGSTATNIPTTGVAVGPNGDSKSGSIGSLLGIWLKDSAASDLASYERALQLMQIGGLQRTTAVQLLEGVELEQEGDTVLLRFLTVVPFFKITETYSLAGPTKMQRRDLKAGLQQAAASIPASGELTVNISWDAPNPGSISEQYRLDSSGRLEITATVRVGGGAEVTRQVYTKATRWSPQFTWPPGGLFRSP